MAGSAGTFVATRGAIRTSGLYLHVSAYAGAWGLSVDSGIAIVHEAHITGPILACGGLLVLAALATGAMSNSFQRFPHPSGLALG